MHRVLLRLEVVAEAIGPGLYLVGAAFARHVIFAGCSPHLALEPIPGAETQTFCHVALHGPFDSPRLIIGPHSLRPRCPRCRAPIADWQLQLNAWIRGAQPAHCGRCGQVSPTSDLDWRRHAIVATSLIEVRNVFPGEAVPSDLLLQQLGAETGNDWRFAWAGQGDPSDMRS